MLNCFTVNESTKLMRHLHQMNFDSLVDWFEKRKIRLECYYRIIYRMKEIIYSSRIESFVFAKLIENVDEKRFGLIVHRVLE